MTNLWLAGAALLQSLTAPNSDVWEILLTENGREFSVDRGSISRSGDTAQVVVRSRMPGNDDARAATIVVMRVTFDCRTQRSQLQTADAYRGDGSYMGSSGGQGLEETVRPGTPSEAAFALACGER